jgi:hypothetical protein
MANVPSGLSLTPPKEKTITQSHEPLHVVVPPAAQKYQFSYLFVRKKSDMYGSTYPDTRMCAKIYNIMCVDPSWTDIKLTVAGCIFYSKLPKCLAK